jgi:uroporphyrinogen decarboxylase
MHIIQYYVLIEIFSLQPWRQYGTDGCILFSDILTPLEGMGVRFDILERIGPVLQPLTSISEIDKCMSGSFDPYTSTPFIREILQNLRHEVKNTAAVLGFIGLPYTLATYIVEGGSSKEFKGIKTMGYNNPKTLHHLLNILSDNIANYALYQIESGAQIIQVFDSWAGNLSPYDYDTFAKPYQSKVIEQIKKKYPDVPIIIYINKSGALIERMASVGADIVSLDWTVSIKTGKSRIGKAVGIQGNLDPMALFGSKESIKAQTETILREGGGQNHIMNLGHGIDAETPEENAQYFVDVVKKFRHEKQ